MTLKEMKALVEEVELLLCESAFTTLHVFERNGQTLALGITERLRRICRKGRVWKSKHMLTALKNAEYGFDQEQVYSRGGSDGIFILTRDFHPKNEMMKKIFDKFVDKPASEAISIASELDVFLDELIPVRLVSHHLRLLGLLKLSKDGDILVLVDYDSTK